jgi:hypothetical protein
MSITVRACGALCAAVFALVSFAPSVAVAQLTPVGSPVIEVFAGDATASQPAGGEFTFAPVAGGYALTGDAHFLLPNPPITPQFSAFVYGYQRVTVGPLPVQISPTAAANYKLVNGGGPVSSTFPATTVTAAFGVLESVNGNGTLPVFYQSGDQHVLAGNGFTIIDETIDDIPTYVLGAGLTYELGLQYTLRFNLTDPPFSPNIVVTLEAGGVSTFPGLTVNLAAVTVPEPTSAIPLAAAASGAFLRRRRS